MSTLERAKPKTALSPLVNGARLDQPTFHECYEAMPPSTRAELVGGVVYMPSPMSTDHGDESRNAAGWLFYYQWKTPGVEGGDGPQPSSLSRASHSLITTCESPQRWEATPTSTQAAIWPARPS